MRRERIGRRIRNDVSIITTTLTGMRSMSRSRKKMLTMKKVTDLLKKRPGAKARLPDLRM